ncbi:Cornifelin [Paragonimus skrjabini miyazakii]|uniref:Cornifelin n=1 Tax=Paragonimus skrjabini miyazakii TaxID=59628 RepID=A0A8S9ZBK5_9TREM|nr:Cornifelin [Paragonimus skrjabini miyazakii]
MHSEFVSPHAPGPQINVIVNQPEQLSRYSQRDWHDGLFSCCNDVKNCLLTAFCYHCMQCYMYGRYGECCGTAALIPMAGVVLSVKHRIRHRIHVRQHYQRLLRVFIVPVMCLVSSLSRHGICGEDEWNTRFMMGPFYVLLLPTRLSASNVPYPYTHQI